MAASSSSLRFTVEIAADQADKTLKALTAAFNEAGVQGKIALASLGGSAKQAGAEVISLGDRIKQVARDQRSEARAASFYAQSIAEVIPISNSAKVAISGITEAMIGGVGIGAAIAIVTTAIKLMTEAWKEEEAAAKKAADERAKRIDEIQKKIDANRVKGQTPAEVARDQVRLVEMQIGERQATIAALVAENAADEARINAAGRYDPNIGNAIERRQAEIGRLLDDITRARTEIEKLREFVQSDIEAAANAVQVSRKDVEITSAEARPYFYEGGGARRPVVRSGTFLPLGGDSVIDPEKNAKWGEHYWKEYNAGQREAIQLSQQWGAALGAAFGEMMAGEASAQQVLARVGQMMIAQITQIAIQSITASAAKAGGEAAASQAGIPVVGPVLAVSAMGAMMSMVLGLLGRVGKRASGGAVLGGMPYMVGELGPELFVPGRSGGIVPHHKIGGVGGGITLNVQGTLVSSRDLEATLTARDSGFSRAVRTMQRRRRL